jgi:hypothetical protein
MSGARQVVTRAPHRRVGYIACPWFQTTPIEYKSLLERDFVRLALLDLQNAAIGFQPFIINLGEKFGNYVPDFLLKRKDRDAVIEVKPSVYASGDPHRERLRHATEVVADKGYDFIVATEEFIRDDRRHDRAGILLRHARSHLPLEVTVRTLAIASDYPSGIPIGNLAAMAGVPSSTVLHLIGRRQLRIDPSLYMDDSQLVYPLERQ